MLSDLRIFLEIFGWFEPHGRIRGGLAPPFEEIDIENRLTHRAADLSRIGGCLTPDQEMANFFSADLEKGRMARPPYCPYVVSDSQAVRP